jgi:hypothetical protein
MASAATVERRQMNPNPKHQRINKPPLVSVACVNTDNYYLLVYEKGAIVLKDKHERTKWITRERLDNALKEIMDE